MADIVGGSVVWDLDVDNKKLSAGLADARKDVKNAAEDVDSNFSKAAKSITEGLESAKAGSIAFAASLAAVGAATVSFGMSSVKAYQESQDSLAQLEAVLKSTGGASGLFVGDILDQAAALQKVTKFGDEAVVSSANLLLTFTEIKGPIMQRAIATTLDMSQALGQDLKGSAIQLGKALNDPIQGVTALRRVGVSFNDQQLEQIKTLQESGRIMEAQTLILNELNKEFGGSAVAAGKTFSGQMEIAKNTFNDFQELIGKAIVDRLAPLVGAFNDWVKAMGGPEGVMEKWNNDIFPKIERNLPIITGIIIGGLVPAVYALGAAFVTMMVPLIPFIVVGAAVGLAVKLILDAFGGFENMKKIFQDAINAALKFVTDLRNALNNLNSSIRSTFSNMFSSIQNEVSSWPRRLFDFGANIGRALVDGIKQGLSNIRDAFVNGFNSARRAIEGHSPPKEGPFKNIDQWGFNIGSAWVEGIQSAVEQFKMPHFEASVGFGGDRSLAPLNMGNGAEAGSNMGQQITINIAKVDSREDVDSIIHELGYRAALSPGI